MANPPYVPTPIYKVQTMIELAELTPGQSMIDMGSGDGRIPIAFAKQGVRATGIEFDQNLITSSIQKSKNEGVTELVTFRLGDFWKTDISTYDAIVVFGMGSIMKRLEYKISSEAKKGTKVLSHVFHFQKLKLIKSKKEVYMYLVR